jgi:penicillin-binding protein 2
MPSEEWKIKNFKQKWYAGETISVGIGQGAVATTPIQLARAIGAITTDGSLRRPHIAFPEQFPPEFKQVAKYNDESKIPIDEKNWMTITDAMAQVVSPMGTAGRAAVSGVDIAGKTGSAQTVSNDLKKKMGASEKSLYKDNGWFVGVTPRRNPELVVACLFEGGEHGALAAQVATKVIKAYVEKQRNRQTQVAKATAPAPKQAEVAAVWHAGDSTAGDNKVQGGHYTVPLDAKTKVKPVAAAPGVGEGEQPLPASTLEATESHTEMANPEAATPVPAQPGQSDMLQAPSSGQSSMKQIPKKPAEKPSTPATDAIRRSDQ